MTNHNPATLPDLKRAELFRVASREFAAYGFAQASLNRIISAVSMSKSSFYHYFNDKTDLYRQILKQAVLPLEKMDDMLDLEHIEAADFWPKLAAISGDMVADLGSSSDMIDIARMFYRSLETPEDRALTEDLMKGFNVWLARVLDRGQTLKQVRDDLPQSLLIELLMSLGVSVDRWMLAHWEGLDEEERQYLNREILGIFRRILSP